MHEHTDMHTLSQRSTPAISLTHTDLNFGLQHAVFLSVPTGNSQEIILFTLLSRTCAPVCAAFMRFKLAQIHALLMTTLCVPMSPDTVNVWRPKLGKRHQILMAFGHRRFSDLLVARYNDSCERVGDHHPCSPDHQSSPAGGPAVAD